jgi:hypothetical protein
MPTIRELSEAGITRITFKPVCPDCARLKVLLREVWDLREGLAAEQFDGYDFIDATTKLKARIKQEGI